MVEIVLGVLAEQCPKGRRGLCCSPKYGEFSKRDGIVSANVRSDRAYRAYGSYGRNGEILN